MKKVFAIIAVVLLACLSVTGLYTKGETAYAAGLEDYGDLTTVVEPTKVHANGQTYYRINSDAKGTAMDKWRWVGQNFDAFNNITDHVVIEEDLDFSKYDKITSLSFLNIKENTSKIEGSIKFNIEGGTVVTDSSGKFLRLDSRVAKILNYSLVVNKTNNLGFINWIDGSTIKDLIFENANFTTTTNNYSDDCFIGGVVAKMIDGVINNVSFNGKITLINSGTPTYSYKAALGGLIGRMNNGMISACDFNGDLIGVEKVGGLVGEIPMGIQNSVGAHIINNVKISDSYMKGSIIANKSVGGIIGDIGYIKYNYPQDLKSLANIDVSRVYTNADIKATQLNESSYGVLGNIQSTESVWLPGDAVPTEIKLPIANIKFNNLVSKTVSYTDNGLVTFQAQTPSAIIPSTDSRTITEGEFSYAGSYVGYNIGKVWIMAGDTTKFLDLKYKYDIQAVQAKIVGAATGCRIAELNKALSGNVNFINGQPIIMTINPEAGVHINTINAKFNGKTINLFTAKNDIRNFATDQEFFDYYGGSLNNFVKYDYRTYKLTINPQVNGNYIINDLVNTFTLFTKHSDGTLSKGDDVVIEFDFSSGITAKSENTYRFSTAGYNGNDKIGTDITGNNIVTLVGKTDFNHSAKDIKVFLKNNFEDIQGVKYSKFSLNSIEVRSRRGVEFFEDRFIEKVPTSYNGFVGTMYTFHLERLDLYDKDAVELRFNFIANDAVFNVPNIELLDLVYIDKNDTPVTTPKFYQDLKIKFKIKDIYKNEYGLNLYDELTKKQFISKNDTKMEVTFDAASGYFTTNKLIKIDGSTSLIDINVAKKVETTIRESGVKLTPPNLLIYNVPVFDSTNSYIIGFVQVQMLYTNENGTMKISQGLVSGSLVDDKIIANNAVLFTVDGNGVKFNSIAGINHKVKIYDNDADLTNNYYTLKSYEVDTKNYDFTLADGIGTIELNNYNISRLTVLLYFTPKQTNVNLVLREVYGSKENFDFNVDKYVDKEIRTSYKPYGENFIFNTNEIMFGLKSDYAFAGWYSTDVTVPTVSDTTYSFRIEGNVTNVYILLRPLYKVNFNISDAERHNGNVQHEGTKIEGEFKFALNAYNNTNNKLVFNIVADRNVTTTVEYELNTSDDQIFVFDAKAMTITVDMAKLEALRAVTSLETHKLLNVNINVKFAPKHINTIYNTNTINSLGNVEMEQGGQMTVRDGNKNEIIYVIGSNLVINYAENMYIETTIRNGYKLLGWYITYGDGKEIKLEKGITEHTIGGITTSTIYLDNITNDFSLVAKFQKDASMVCHKIENVEIEEGYIDVHGNFVKTDTNNLADINFEFSINASDTNKDNIPDGSKVEVTYENLNKRYMFYSWVAQVTIGGQIIDTSTNPDTNLGIFTIDSLKNDIYKITLRVVAKTFSVKVYFDEGIKIRLNNEQDFLPYNALGNVLSVKYGESVKLSFIADKNPNYYVNKWEEFKITNPTDNSGEYSNFTSNNYDITEIANNYEIRLVVGKKIDESGSGKVNLVKHAVSLEGNGTGYIAVTNNGDGNITLSAVPSGDSKFVKWVKGNGKYSDNSKIKVVNEVGDTYYAVFTRKSYSVYVNSSDAFISDAPLEIEAGKTVVIELGVKPGYKVDKIIINGSIVIPIGSVTKFELHNVSEAQNIQVVYHKEGMTKADKTLAQTVVVLLVVSIIIAIAVKVILSNKHTPKGKRKDKSKNINID